VSRYGRCRMCERTTEFRAVEQGGRLECLPCGDRILASTFVEMPTGHDLLESSAKFLGISRMPDNTPIPSLAELEAEMAELQRKLAVDADRLMFGPPALGHVDHLVNEALAAKLDAARKRIADLEAASDARRDALVQAKDDAEEWKNKFWTAEQKRQRLSDVAGDLNTEMTQCKAELCDALRRVERLKRQVKR